MIPPPKRFETHIIVNAIPYDEESSQSLTEYPNYFNVIVIRDVDVVLKCIGSVSRGKYQAAITNAFSFSSIRFYLYPHAHGCSANQIYTHLQLAPFSFNISCASTGEVLFTIADNRLIFEPQYLRLKTTLSPMPNIYGLGEHSEPFRLDTTSTTRTL
jgi:hypothetical protein